MIHLAFLALLGSQAADTARFSTTDGSIVVSDISVVKKLTYDLDSGDRTVAGTGNPAHIFLNSIGVEISAKFVSGKTKDTATKTYLAEAHTIGDTKMIEDSSAANSFQTKAGKTRVPGTSQTTYRMELDTDQTDYIGSETQGKLIIPGIFDLHGHAESSKDDDDAKRPIHIRASQQLDMHGARGEFNVDPRPGNGVQAIKDGVFEGPITFAGQRTVMDFASGKRTAMKLQNGHCDRVRIVTDAKGETIVLEGHVSFDLQDENGAIHIPNAESFKFLFDTDLNPLSIDGTDTQMSVPLKG